MSLACTLPPPRDNALLCRPPRPAEHAGGTYSITSMGGVGSTFLLEWLKRLERGFQREADCQPIGSSCGCAALAAPRALPRHLVSCHVDDDGIFKHLADPITLNAFGSRHRAVFVVGSPTSAVASVFRRRFQCWHLHRLHGCWFTRRQRDGHIDCASPSLAAFRRQYGEAAATCRVPPVGPLSSLEAYAAEGADLFGVVEQFGSWLSCRAPRCTFDVLVLRYETLNASLGTLFDFLELPPAVRDLFPHAKLRGAHADRPEEARGVGARTQLDRLYGGLEAAIARLPPTGLLLRNADIG